MITQVEIDVSSVLRRTVCDLYSNLVTRSTGAAVRTEIEHLVSDCGGRTLTIVDFCHVNTLDYSCADEVVAKLLLRFTRESQDAYFLFRGVRDEHLEAIESVLERYELALVAESPEGECQLVGRVDDDARVVWQEVARRGRVCASDLAGVVVADIVEAEQLLSDLHRRRLVIQLDSDYVSPRGIS
jgi:hypothetical protein